MYKNKIDDDRHLIVLFFLIIWHLKKCNSMNNTLNVHLHCQICTSNSL